MIGTALLTFALELGTGSGGAVGQWNTSLEAVEAGGWTLSPYRGPLLQPVFGLRMEHVELAVAPALSMGRQDLVGADGRSLTVGWTQWRVEARAAWVADRLRVLSLIHISEPRDLSTSRMPSSA